MKRRKGSGPLRPIKPKGKLAGLMKKTRGTIASGIPDLGSNAAHLTNLGCKLAAMNTAAFFAERRERADFAAFDRLMRRKGGEPPQPEDRMPRGSELGRRRK